MVLVNSADLLRCDLDGVHVLLPAIIEALEAVLPEQELKMRPTNVSKTDLRRAAIQLLISMLALPNHFQVCAERVTCLEFFSHELYGFVCLDAI